MNGAATAGSPDGTVDRMGAVASGVCAVHCAVCAMLPSALAALGLGVLLSHEAEWALTVIAVVLAVVALILGWKRDRSSWIPWVFGVGIVGLLASRFLEEGGGQEIGTAVGVLAGCALVVGHLASLRSSRRRQAEPG